MYTLFQQIIYSESLIGKARSLPNAHVVDDIELDVFITAFDFWLANYTLSGCRHLHLDFAIAAHGALPGAHWRYSPTRRR